MVPRLDGRLWTTSQLFFRSTRETWTPVLEVSGTVLRQVCETTGLNLDRNDESLLRLHGRGEWEHHLESNPFFSNPHTRGRGGRRTDWLSVVSSNEIPFDVSTSTLKRLRNSTLRLLSQSWSGVFLLKKTSQTRRQLISVSYDSKDLRSSNLRLFSKPWSGVFLRLHVCKRFIRLQHIPEELVGSTSWGLNYIEEIRCLPSWHRVFPCHLTGPNI